MKFQIVIDETKPDVPTLKTRLIVDGDGDLLWQVWHNDDWWNIACVAQNGECVLFDYLPEDFPLPVNRKGQVDFK